MTGVKYWPANVYILASNGPVIILNDLTSIYNDHNIAKGNITYSHLFSDNF